MLPQVLINQFQQFLLSIRIGLIFALQLHVSLDQLFVVLMLNNSALDTWDPQPGMILLEVVVVSVLPLGRFLASIFSTLSCLLPFSLVPHTTILSETRSAYPIVSFLLVFFLSSDPLLSYLTSHILGKSREVVSRCLPPGVFTETPSPALVSFTIRPSSSLFRDVGFAYTGEISVVHHALSFHRGTTCRWCDGQLGVEAF